MRTRGSKEPRALTCKPTPGTALDVVLRQQLSSAGRQALIVYCSTVARPHFLPSFHMQVMPRCELAPIPAAADPCQAKGHSGSLLSDGCQLCLRSIS